MDGVVSVFMAGALPMQSKLCSRFGLYGGIRFDQQGDLFLCDGRKDIPRFFG